MSNTRWERVNNFKFLFVTPRLWREPLWKGLDLTHFVLLLLLHEAFKCNCFNLPLLRYYVDFKLYKVLQKGGTMKYLAGDPYDQL